MFYTVIHRGEWATYARPIMSKKLSPSDRHVSSLCPLKRIFYYACVNVLITAFHITKIIYILQILLRRCYGQTRSSVRISVIIKERMFGSMLDYHQKTITASQYADQKTGDVFLPTGLRRNNNPHVQVLTIQRQEDDCFKATCFDFDHCCVRTLIMLPTQPLIVEV